MTKRARIHQLGLDIIELERRAFDLGLPVTARTLNRAKDALGWEGVGREVSAKFAAAGQKRKAVLAAKGCY